MADKGFIDFHIHTTRSDGRYTPEEVTDLAVDSGVTVMALTDHNRLSPDIDELMLRHAGRLTILRGIEISCRHKFADGETKEIHVVALMYDKKAPHLEEIVRRNRKHNREGYILAILRKLKENCGIDIGTYEELCAGRVNPSMSDGCMWRRSCGISGLCARSTRDLTFISAISA